MSKYQKTINLWDNGIMEAIENGSLVLQSGQWVTCNRDGIKSVFDYAKSTYIRAYHSGGNMTARKKYLAIKRGKL